MISSMYVLRVLMVVATIFLSGAWLAFGLPIKRLSFWDRVVISAALSPLVIGGMFYLLRLSGLPFDSACWGVVFMSLPASYLV